MAKICIVGTEGAGKTVFLSVFATRYQAASSGHPWMDFKNRKTARYVAEVWGTLANQEWPHSTPPGDFPKLEWGLHTTSEAGQEEHNITVLDAPGQDIRAIFDSDPESLNANQQELQRRLEEADVLLLLVNLVEAIRATDPVQQANVQIPLKLMLDSVLARKNAHVAILLSQHDQLHPYFDNIGVPKNDPIHALRACLPTVYGVAAMAGDHIKIFFIASVAETEPFVDEQGKTWSRPKANFKSEGLSEVMTWLVMAAKGVRSDEQSSEIAHREAEISTYKKELNRLKLSRTGFRTSVIAIALAVLFVIRLFAISHFESTLNSKISAIETLQKSEHVIPAKDWDFNVKEGPWLGMDDIILTNKSQYNFISPRIEVFFKGETIPGKTSDNLILRSEEPFTWDKKYNFHQEQRDAKALVFCRTFLNPEEKQAERDLLIKAFSDNKDTLTNTLIGAFGIILVITFTLPHRNDSKIREMKLSLNNS